jgi:sulfur relay (sulfurtransferase) DsrC/TusE family protein
MAVSNTASSFHHAPSDWSESEARELAAQDGLDLKDDHWEVMRALQEYCSRHDCNKYSVRELHDALGGPIAQGCRLAGLEPPAGAVDLGFGSVV